MEGGGVRCGARKVDGIPIGEGGGKWIAGRLPQGQSGRFNVSSHVIVIGIWHSSTAFRHFCKR